MPGILSDPASFGVFVVTIILGPLLAYLAARAKNRTDNQGRIVSDAMKLKQEYQDDYEVLRKRVGIQDTQIATLNMRVTTLEAEKAALIYQLAMAGITVPSPIVSPLSMPKPAPRT